jgi:hypothetical protein
MVSSRRGDGAWAHEPEQRGDRRKPRAVLISALCSGVQWRRTWRHSLTPDVRLADDLRPFRHFGLDPGERVGGLSRLMGANLRYRFWTLLLKMLDDASSTDALCRSECRLA